MNLYSYENKRALNQLFSLCIDSVNLNMYVCAPLDINTTDVYLLNTKFTLTINCRHFSKYYLEKL